MKIEIDKTYVARNGDIVHIEEEENGLFEGILVTNDGFLLEEWTEDGINTKNSIYSASDIVSEVNLPF